MYEDNRAAFLLATEGAGMRRAKHIDIRYHYLQELVQRKVVEVRTCSSEEQMADALTKSVPREVLQRCCKWYFNE
jgi:hypothetical protein